MLGENPVQSVISVTGYEPPTVAAALPTLPAGDVISMFSGAYNDVLVDTWRADWGGVTTQVEDYPVAGEVTKMYSSLNWVGIEFMTHRTWTFMRRLARSSRSSWSRSPRLPTGPRPRIWF